MPRPKRCRRICGYPDYWSFSPEGAQTPETIVFTLDEYETIRLIDYQKLTQEECASQMGVSRATVTSIYENARFKIADAMVNGRRIRITGGSSSIDSIPASAEINEKGDNIMRIAVTYENEMVGQHFGRTEQFKIYDIDNGRIVSSEVVGNNGFGHGSLAGYLKDMGVEALICGGIGGGAMAALAEAGVEVIGGVSGDAKAAVESYLAGTLAPRADFKCNHHHHEEGHSCGGHHHDGEHSCGGHCHR